MLIVNSSRFRGWMYTGGGVGGGDPSGYVAVHPRTLSSFDFARSSRGSRDRPFDCSTEEYFRERSRSSLFPPPYFTTIRNLSYYPPAYCDTARKPITKFDPTISRTTIRDPFCVFDRVVVHIRRFFPWSSRSRSMTRTDGSVYSLKEVLFRLLPFIIYSLLRYQPVFMAHVWREMCLFDV